MNFNFHNLEQLQLLRARLLGAFKSNNPFTKSPLKKSKHNPVITGLQQELYKVTGEKLRISTGTLVDFFFDDSRLSRRQEFIDAINKYVESKAGNAEQHFSRAIACIEQYNYPEALEWLGKAYTQSPDNLQYAKKYADYLRDFGRSDEARALMMKILETETRNHGEDNVTVADIYFSLGMLNEDEDNLKQAVKFYEKAKAIITAAGKHVNDLIPVCNRLSNCYFRVAQLQLAEEMNDWVIKILEESKQVNTNLGFAYRVRGYINTHKGNTGSVKQDLMRSVEVFESLPRTSKFMAGSYDAIGEYYLYIGDYTNAIAYSTKALQITEKLWGRKTARHASHYYRLGNIYLRLKNNTEARRYYLMAIDVYKQTNWSTHVLASMIYNGLAGLEWMDGHTETAKDYWEKALEIQLSFYPVYKDTLAYIYANLSSYYALHNDFAKAERFCANGLDIIIEVKGGQHVFTGEFYNKFVTLYRQKGDKKMGRFYAQKALAILKDNKARTGIAPDLAQRFEENLQWLEMSA